MLAASQQDIDLSMIYRGISKEPLTKSKSWIRNVGQKGKVSLNKSLNHVMKNGSNNNHHPKNVFWTAIILKFS